jgi:hypothetical protein
VRGGRVGGTHLAGVHLLAGEGIFVGTHVGGGDAVPVVSMESCRGRRGAAAMPKLDCARSGR